MTNVDLSRVPEFYHGYINYVAESDLKKAFQKHQADLISTLSQIDSTQWNFRYAPGKWSVKEVVQHVIDAERIFCYRALCIARKEKSSLPGFDENTYANASKADNRTKEDLLEELSIVQKSSAQLFNSFDEEQLNESGIANGKSIYVKAIGYILIGHALHHQKIILEKYLHEKAKPA